MNISNTKDIFNMNVSNTEDTFNMNASSNLTNNAQNETCLKEDTILLIFTLWEILDKLVVLATNGCTIFIIYMHRYDMLEIPSNIFIACLTMSDLLSVVTLPFSIATMYVSHIWAWTVNCILAMSLGYITAMINTVTLCVIAVDRLIYVLYPLQYHTKMPVNRAFFIAISVWVFCSVYSVMVVGLGYTDAYDLGMIARPCTASLSVQAGPRQFLQLPFLIFVPVTIGSYIKVGMVALKQRNVIAAAGGSQAQPAGIDFKITKVMFNVLSVYILCTLVVAVTPLIRDMYLQGNTCGVVFRVSVFIWKINTWLNPVIYAWKSQKFRRYVRAIFKKNQVHGSMFNLI